MRAPTTKDAQLLAQVLEAEYVYIYAEYSAKPMGAKKKKCEADYDRSDRGKPRLRVVKDGT